MAKDPPRVHLCMAYARPFTPQMPQAAPACLPACVQVAQLQRIGLVHQVSPGWTAARCPLAASICRGAFAWVRPAAAGEGSAGAGLPLGAGCLHLSTLCQPLRLAGHQA